VQGINVIDYAILAVSSLPVDLITNGDPTLPGKAKRAYITCEDAAVRWRADGEAPDADEGHMLADGDSISFLSANFRQLLEKIEFIADTGTDGALKITYFD